MKFKILVNLFLTLAAGKFAASEEPFELDEFLKGAFSNIGFNGVWMSDTAFHYKDSTGDVVKFDVVTWSTELLFSASVLTNYTSATYLLSPDLRYLLIEYNPKAIFRHSTIAQFTFYDLETGEYHDIAGGEHIQFAQWAPVGHGLVYVFENNVYYIATPTTDAVQISTDGVSEVIYNGIPDWVYEEEVLGSGSAVWFSPDGSRLAFAHFDDTEVPEFNYFVYGDVNPIENLYPEVVKLRYPKVGATNPDFELRVVTLNDYTNVHTLPILADQQESRDYVLFGVTWPTNEEVTVVIENRVQNEAVVRRCQTGSLTCAIEREFKEDKGWLELGTPVYNSDGTKYLLITSQQESDDSYLHLVLYDTTDNSVLRLIDGERVVTGIGGWDETRNVVYYSGSAARTPSEQHVFFVNLTSGEDTCITCRYLTPDGLCKYASATYSKGYSYFAEICQGPGPNFISINTIDDLEWARVYQNNSVIRAQLSEKLTPVIQDFDVPVEGGFTAKARLLLPPNLDTSGATKYPMIVHVYGGPDSTQITDRFSTGFPSYIVTNRQYIYAYIDGRGSGRKGDNLRFQLYKRMGTVEIEDQIAVTKALRDDLPFIDPTRIGIWGWSYGGFATAWALVQDVENVFKLGLSVAPVTDFKLYDTIYTERYMGLLTPEDNEEGYNNTDLSRTVEGFRNKQFYLIHGNADDNVHYQQSMLLAKALELADIMFYQMSYPDENHALNHVYPHLYHGIDRYWARCFGLPDPVYKHIEKKP